MTIDLYWDNPDHTIFVIQLEGLWTMADFYQKYAEMQQMVEGVEHPIIAITDLSQSRELPRSFLSISSFMRSHRVSNVSFNILVTTNTFYNLTIRTMLKILPENQQRLAVVMTVGEARTIARKKLENIKTT